MGVHQWTAGFAVQISHGGVVLLDVGKDEETVAF
jgi:hypothetical protein